MDSCCFGRKRGALKRQGFQSALHPNRHGRWAQASSTNMNSRVVHWERQTLQSDSTHYGTTDLITIGLYFINLCKDIKTWREKENMLCCILPCWVSEQRLWPLWTCASDTRESKLCQKLVACCLLFSSVWEGGLLKMSAINATAGFIKNK